MKYAYRGSTSTDPMVPHFNHLAVLIRDRALYGILNRLARYVQDRFSAVCAAAVDGKVQ